MIDIAIAQNLHTNEITLHRADCPVVRKMAEDGHPVMTMLGCKEMPDVVDYVRHSCLLNGTE